VVQDRGRVVENAGELGELQVVGSGEPAMDFAQPPLPAARPGALPGDLRGSGHGPSGWPAPGRGMRRQASRHACCRTCVPMKMKLADQSAALLPLTPTGTAGALLVLAPLITAALREYFELLWDNATPSHPNGLRRPPSGCHQRSRPSWR
jgi:hypothetical protein